MNCGKKERKNNATFGFNALVIPPCFTRFALLTAGASEFDQQANPITQNDFRLTRTPKMKPYSFEILVRLKRTFTEFQSKGRSAIEIRTLLRKELDPDTIFQVYNPCFNDSVFFV